MDFDFDRITSPFRMQPGLQRIAPADPQVHRLDPAAPLYAEKEAVFAAGRSRHAVPGFDPSPALRALHERLPAEGPPELAYEEDFAVLDGASGTLPWLCVCVPSHWAPEEKVGLGFAALHAPVADNRLLVAASAPLVRLATSGECWERFVWTVSPSGRHDQHPGRHPRAPWPATADPEAFAAGCWFRAERQTFFPVGGGTRQAMFTIRVMLQPLAQAAQAAGRARRLHDAIATMSDAVLAYKGLAAAREPLLRWLAARSA